MSAGHDDFRAQLSAERIIAIVRDAGADAAWLAAVARVLHRAGLALVELPLTSPAALDAIALLAAKGEGTAVGAGTVLTPDHVDAVVAAGAAFVVTPGVDRDVLGRAREHGVPVVCGAMTATEIQVALRHGAVAVKIFPAGSLGPGYVSALTAPFPDVAFVPAGGIAVSNAWRYLAAGAVAVGLGSDLVGDGSQRHIADQVVALRATML